MVLIGGRKLESADFYKILFEGEQIELDKGAFDDAQCITQIIGPVIDYR